MKTGGVRYGRRSKAPEKGESPPVKNRRGPLQKELDKFQKKKKLIKK